MSPKHKFHVPARSRAICALLVLGVFASKLSETRGQFAPPAISATSSTNGLALSWPGGSSNTVYTIQTRSDLSAGAWRNATMRYRWPSPFTNWADAPLTLRAPRFYRLIAETLPPPARGKLLTNSSPVQLSTNALRTIMVDWSISAFVTPRFPVETSRFSYETIDPFGLPILASALWVFPQ